MLFIYLLEGTEPFSARTRELLVRSGRRGDQMFTSHLDAGAVGTFAFLRSSSKLKIADSIHLACAASAGIDLFLTGDKQLAKLDVPGIQFIAEFNNPVL
jgi:predicted nucleic acid-binding protein